MKRLKGIIISALTLAILIGIVLFGAYYIFNINITLALIVFAIAIIFTIICISTLSNLMKDDYKAIESKLSSVTKMSFEEGKIGVVIYDKSFKITYMSEYLRDRLMDHIGENLLSWLPDTQDIVMDENEKGLIIINDEKYEVKKQGNTNTLIFREVTFEYDLQNKLDKSSLVLGMLNYDNYDESNESEETANYVTAVVKQPVMEYFSKFGIVYKTLRNNRLQLILNKEKYELLLKDHFSILNSIRKEAKTASLDITVSMAFAIGYEDLSEMETQVRNLLELTQTRGGDQVAVKEKDNEPQFFGGSSEAKERQSKVKVRVMTNTLRHLLEKASSIFIVGHDEADADCIGSMLGMARISSVFNEKTYVITEGIKIEPMTKDVLNKYNEALSKDVNRISEYEAEQMLNANSLIIMCDHHSITQSACKSILKNATNVVIVDHHRRKADLDVNAILLYVEASASSTCELISEFFEYATKAKISPTIANIMYLGMVIDTNHFRVRTGMASFEAARRLKSLGADPVLVEELIQEPFEMVKKRTDIISNAQRFNENMLIAKMNNGEEYPRSIASQACDNLIQSKDIEAVFVICNTNSDETMISARSKGDTNVQLIMEKMNGGGHKTAAGLQKKNTTVDKLAEELQEAIMIYLSEKEGMNDESNTTK